MFQKINNRLILTDQWYSFGKKFVQVILPAISSLYFGLGNIWGFPAIENVVGTCAVVATFLGVCLGISSRQYDASGAAKMELAKNADGAVVITTTEEGRKLFSLEIEGDPEELEQHSSLVFKVVTKE